MNKKKLKNNILQNNYDDSHLKEEKNATF